MYTFVDPGSKEISRCHNCSYLDLYYTCI